MPTPETPALRSETGFDLLFKNAVIGIIAVNNKGIIQAANPYSEKIFGFPPGQMEGTHLEALLPEALRNKHNQLFAEYFENPVARPMDSGMQFTALRRDGSEFPVEISLSHFELKETPLIIAFICDITERKKIEAELRNNEQRFKLLITHTPAAVAMFDNQMRYIVVSKRWIEDYNIGKRDVTGLSHYEVFPEITPAIKEIHQRCLAGETLSHPQYPFQRVDGKLDWVKWEMCPWYKTGGEIGGAILFTEVITAQKEAEQKLKLLNENRESKVAEKTKELLTAIEREKDLGEMKSRFVSMASHEFRTPLSTILSSVFLLEKYNKPEDEEKKVRHFLRIRNAVNTLREILNEFLSLGKIEQGVVKNNPIYFDVREFCHEVIEEMTPFYKKGQEIKYEHNGLQQVFLDRQHLKNVINNLLSNAIKYSPEEKCIYFTSEITANKVTFVVKDSGIGIPEEDKAHLFESFFRAKNAVNIQGTGIGLHIVKKYLDLMGGTIRFESELYEGSSFTIEFPAKNS